MMTPSQPVTLYISAAPELMAEREALAQMIARLPVSLPWHIVQTPRNGELVNLAALQMADLFFLLMGSDIQAPVGSEWHLAQQAGCPAFVFLKREITQTPAGQVFARQVRATWRPFAGPADLSQQVQRIVVEHLLAHALDYPLTPTEVSELEKRLTTTTPVEEAVGAGHSAILISRERFSPREGVVIGGDDET